MCVRGSWVQEFMKGTMSTARKAVTAASHGLTAAVMRCFCALKSCTRGGGGGVNKAEMGHKGWADYPRLRRGLGITI